MFDSIRDLVYKSAQAFYKTHRQEIDAGIAAEQVLDQRWKQAIALGESAG